jgi:uncharacterized protein (TIGR00369 family)
VSGGNGLAIESALAFAESRPEATRTRLLTWQDPLRSVAAAAGLSGLEYMQRIAAGEIPPPPIAVTLNFAMVSVDRGKAVFDGHPAEEHYNPIGVVHGGYAATLLDSAMGCAVHTTLEAGEAYTTLTLESKFVRPITGDSGAVRAAADVVHRGRRQATAEARLTDVESGELLAHASSTCLVISG